MYQNDHCNPVEATLLNLRLNSCDLSSVAHPGLSAGRACLTLYGPFHSTGPREEELAPSRLNNQGQFDIVLCEMLPSRAKNRVTLFE